MTLVCGRGAMILISANHEENGSTALPSECTRKMAYDTKGKYHFYGRPSSDGEKAGTNE
jgi:hypothetical protein